MSETITKSYLDVIIAGSIAGCASVLACHPFDVIRTHWQLQLAQNQNKSAGELVPNSLLQVIREIRMQGDKNIFNFYQGLLPPFTAQAFYKSIIFVSYSISMERIFDSYSPSTKVFLSGTIAGSINAFVVAPIEYLRTQQITKNDRLSNLIESLVKSKNLHFLWSSLLPSILRDGPGVGVYFLTYSLMKAFLTSNENQEPLLLRKIVAGSLAGISYWTWALPFDVIKTNIENENKFGTLRTTVLTTTRLIHQRGILGLYRAWPIAFGRGIPSAAITLSTYEIILERLSGMK